MNLTCDIVMDLVALYKDKLASKDSVEAIESHLKDCPTCKQYYKKYDSINKNQFSKSTASPSDYYMDGIAALSAKLKKKHIISNAMIASIAGLSLTVMLVSIFKLKKSAV